MLYIWHSGCFMNPTHKWYFWPFLYPKITFFVIFAQICPKNMNFWMVDITFFVFVVSRDWRYMSEVYYYTFKKIKKFWSWPTSVGPVHPSKSKTMKKKIFFMVFDFEGCTGPTEVGQLQNFFYFFESIIVNLWHVSSISRDDKYKKSYVDHSKIHIFWANLGKNDKKCDFWV